MAAASSAASPNQPHPECPNGNRLALLVGVDKYEKPAEGRPKLGSLQHAVSDAKAMKALLERAGFQTRLVQDPTTEQLGNAFEDLADDISPARYTGPDPLVLVFFAGHGFAHSGRLKFMASDYGAAHVGWDDHCTCDGLVSRLYNACNEMTLVFLGDCCREDQQDMTFRSFALGADLTETYTDQDPETFRTYMRTCGLGPDSQRHRFVFCFACREGHAANERDALGHGCFAHALLEHLPRARGQTLENVWPKIVAEVRSVTSSQQSPMMETDSPGVVLFRALAGGRVNGWLTTTVTTVLDSYATNVREVLLRGGCMGGDMIENSNGEPLPLTGTGWHEATVDQTNTDSALATSKDFIAVRLNMGVTKMVKVRAHVSQQDGTVQLQAVDARRCSGDFERIEGGVEGAWAMGTAVEPGVGGLFVSDVTVALASDALSPPPLAATMHQVAADPGDCRQLRNLIEQRAVGINTLDEHGRAPIHYACASGCSEAVVLLLDHGADVNLQATSGATPLHYAMAVGHPAIVSILDSRGAEVHARTADGSTPAHLASSQKQNFVSLFELLHKADMRLKDNRNMTPLELMLGLRQPSKFVQGAVNSISEVKPFLDQLPAKVEQAKLKAATTVLRAAVHGAVWLFLR